MASWMFDTVVDGLDQAINVDRVRLAVTGLSRAGKTVFITSLIHNLLAMPHANTLPRLAARLARGDGGSRLRTVRVLPAGAGVLPVFDYGAKLRGLAADQPGWPPRTEDLAQVSLALEVDRPSAVGRWLGTRRIRLDILDYPGEWLLDLPMLGQGYKQWSRHTLDLLRTAPRDAVFEPFLAFIGGLGPDDRAEEELLRRGHALFKDALHRCRVEHGLRYLQPGRFICPGPYSDAPFMWFFPLPAAADSPRAGSNAALLAERYERYREHIRTTFFDTHFAQFDRQLMLVDVLGALCAGRAAFEDTARTLAEVAQGLRYRGSSLLAGLAGLGGGGGIGRVTFVATKADHVPALKRDNLSHLLRQLAEGSRGEGAASKVRVGHQVVASVLSTTDDVATVQGRPMEVVLGTLLGQDTPRPFLVGDVPASGPPEGYWRHAFFELPAFRPPPIDPHGRAGIAHLNLDAVLDDTIGDLL